MTKEQIEETRRGMHAMGWSHADALCDAALKSLDQGAQEAVAQVGERLWLWKNFVDGKPEYWAFEHAYPAYASGDPITIGSPCGYALVRPSTNGKPNVKDAEVLAEISRSHPAPAAELIEALREEFAKIYQGRKGSDSICAGTEAFEAARRITELLARK